MLQFNIIRDGVQKQFNKMAKENSNLFTVDLDVDALWNLYLDTIPAEHNLIYKKKREYDCSCCKHFFKRMGNVVAITEANTLVSIWDIEVSDPIWQKVADTLSAYVKSYKVNGIFCSKEDYVGTMHSMSMDENKNPIEWNHFYLDIPMKFTRGLYSGNVAEIKGEAATQKRVFKSSLEGISEEALSTVLELINQNSLYKGEEWRDILTKFKKYQKEYHNVLDELKDNYCWRVSQVAGSIITRLKNHSIGLLLQNITDGMELDEAVRKYEIIVAPTNYKRSKPIYTKKMLEDAKKKITELGYLDSLQRRFANLDDITVNNILFSNKDASKRIKGAEDIFDELAKTLPNKPQKFNKVDEISIEDFINNVLPTANSVEAYVEGKNLKNLVSLIAPVNKDSKIMFKWNNNFSWAYRGNVTDSIVKQNVKNAGGKVDGVLRFSIQWNDVEGDWDKNDEDAHCIEPTGHEIYYGDKEDRRTEGNLDVDIINPDHGKPAVENITWPNLKLMPDGDYRFFVNCYTARGGKTGFRAEIEFNGQIYSYDYHTPLTHSGQNVDVAIVTKRGDTFEIKHKLPSNESTVTEWGISTNQFIPVSVICYSPNYWDLQNGIGNKHYFFMLDGCVNEEEPSGWYNEFLNQELYQNHRKVMEALGMKCHVEDVADQLSGLGFSSTLRNELVVKVKGNMERVLKIKF